MSGIPKLIGRLPVILDMEERLPETGPSQQELLDFFTEHVARVYCAKSQLADKLPLLARQAGFLDLQQAIEETVEEIHAQLQRLREIFILLDTYYQPASCAGLVGILDEAFQSIGPQLLNKKLRDLSIIFYMQNIESIEVASFKILQIAARALERPDVVQLLRECYDEAREDTVLYKQLMSGYIKL